MPSIMNAIIMDTKGIIMMKNAQSAMLAVSKWLDLFKSVERKSEME
ncbi:MAG: hypothetical protein FGF48_03205 [Candidatus Brockarchaeota archaeon]|nr:hypothetical protein [Candidatus Brockarchaeota archaeon]